MDEFCNIWVNPFWENDVAALVQLLGADRVTFGSDYPHPEGLADPVSYADELAEAGIDAATRGTGTTGSVIV